MAWTLDRLTPALGAELHGISDDELRDPIVFDSLHQHLMEHQVLVINGLSQDPLSLARLGRGLGEIASDHHLYSRHADCDDVVVLEWGGDDKPDAAEWHADMTYRPEPPFASVLQAQIVPTSGGDTLWASMYSACNAIPAGLKSELSELSAVHDMGAFRTPAYEADGAAGINSALADTGSAVHPVIARHPVTGREYLNVSESFTRFIIGLSAPESARVLTLLFDLINRPEHHMRVRWQPGTVAIWDNRGTQHYAIADYLPQRRVMHRVAVATDQRSQSTALAS